MLKAIEIDPENQNLTTLDLEDCELEMGAETPDCLRYGSGAVFEDLYLKGIVLYKKQLLPLFSCEMDSVLFVVEGETDEETTEFVEECLNAHAGRQREKGRQRGLKEARQNVLRSLGL